jgi:Holliday junction resolvasome RuvABC endonuclease subunit
LALDIGMTSTGWCAGVGNSIPACGAWPFAPVGDDLGALGDALHDYLNAALDRYRPDLLVYESPIVIHNRNGKGNRADKLPFLRKRLGMDFYVETVATRRGIIVRDVSIQEIKKELTGRADAGKDDMVAVARKCGLALPAKGTDDAADAFGAWLFALRTQDRAAAARFDRLIYGHRGGLL